MGRPPERAARGAPPITTSRPPPGAPPGAPRRSDLQLFLNAAGRVDRLTYVAAMAPVVLLLRVPAIFADDGARAVVEALCWPLALVVAATLTAKRLHDIGLAGWWTALHFLLAVVMLSQPEGAPAGAAAAWGLGVCLALLAVWPGEPDFNRFGPVVRFGAGR
jgi:uncharacterized membrane protein YhaH (DUF805 family)